MVLTIPRGFVSIAEAMLSKAPYVLLVLWLWLAIAETTQANSAKGGNTLFANTLNPTGTDTTQRRDERGLATFKETLYHSNQLERYYKELENIYFKPKNILPIYYKTEDQGNYSKIKKDS